MAYQEYLPSILIEFDWNGALKESAMMQYFRKDLKLSIKVEIEQRGQELDSFNKIVEKTVDIEAKIALRP